MFSTTSSEPTVDPSVEAAAHRCQRVAMAWRDWEAQHDKATKHFRKCGACKWAIDSDDRVLWTPCAQCPPFPEPRSFL